MTGYTSVKFCFYWTRNSGISKKKRNRYLCSLGVFLTNVSNILTKIVWKFAKEILLLETVQKNKFWKFWWKLERKKLFFQTIMDIIFWDRGVKLQNLKNSHKCFIFIFNLIECRVKPQVACPHVTWPSVLTRGLRTLDLWMGGWDGGLMGGGWHLEIRMTSTHF